MDVEAVLLSVQERDKWRHRLQVLQRSLDEIRHRRQRLTKRLRRIKQDLARLKDVSDAILDPLRAGTPPEPIHAANNSRIIAR
jgi:septal ring factor EnvC (AmiA/AmiB activator)